MSWYKLPSVYSQKMTRLSCKIFGEYYTPPPPKEVMVSKGTHELRRWNTVHHQNEASIFRGARKPRDVDEWSTIKYYPAHPQIRSLMYNLRAHGLFRDEHLDFIMEMKRLRALRGKKGRVLGGGGGKRSKKE